MNGMFFPQTGAVFVDDYGIKFIVILVAKEYTQGRYMVVYEPQDKTMARCAHLEDFAENFTYVSNTGWEPS